MEYYCIDHIHHGLAPWISLGFAALLVGLYLSAKRVLPQSGGSQSLVVTFASIVCFHSIYLELLPHHIRPWLFVVIVLLGAFIPMRDFKEPLSIWAVPAVTLLIVALLEYLAMLWHLLTIGITSWIIAPLAGLAALWVLLIKSNQPGEREESFVGGLLLAAAHLLAIMSFYRLTTDYGSLAVSATWLCYAVSVIVLSFVRKDQVMAKSALLVLGLAAGKALLYDAASAPTLIRIFCLLLTGAVLYGCGFFMRKTASWKKI